MTVVLLLLAAAILSLTLFTRANVRRIERDYPPVGEMIDVGGYRLHAVHIRAPETADLPPLVFLHGASGNLRDQLEAFRPALEGRAEMLFIDRPGHGWSQRGPRKNTLPDGQADAIAAAISARGIDRAVIVGHSFGGAIAASFALVHPERTAGLLFLAPATHPWPGGISWYYRLASKPLLGPVFCHLIVMPVGLASIVPASHRVFAPNPMPEDYVERTAPALVLRPRAFRSNALDVAGLYDYVLRTAPHYREIRAPTVIVTGDRDAVVLEEIHSRGLARDIPGAELVRIAGLGHKPDYVVTDVAVAAIEKLAGKAADLHAAAGAAEKRIASGRSRGWPRLGEAAQMPVSPSEPI